MARRPSSLTSVRGQEQTSAGYALVPGRTDLGAPQDLLRRGRAKWLGTTWQLGGFDATRAAAPA